MKNGNSRLLKRCGLTFLFILLFSVAGSTVVLAGPKAYVADTIDNTVAVIDTTTNNVLKTIPVGSNPSRIIVSPDSTRVYVLNSVSNNVSVITTLTDAAIAQIPVGNGPTSAVISPDGSHLYVGNFSDGSVSIINTATNSVVNTISTQAGSFLENIIISPDGSRVYTANGQNPGSVTVIDTGTNTKVIDIPVGNLPFGLAISPDGTSLYVTNLNDKTLTEIDTVGLVSFPAIPIDISISLAFTSDGSHVYVVNATFFGSVSVVRTSDNTIVRTIPMGVSPTEILVSSDGKRAYVMSPPDSTISVIDTASDMVISTTSVGSGPRAMALSKDDSRLYVVSGDNTVSVMDTFTNHLFDVVAPIGDFAQPIAISSSELIPETFAYVTDNSSNVVSRIETGTNTQVDSVNLSHPTDSTIIIEPGKIVWLPDTSRYYVTLQMSSNVLVVDAETNIALEAIEPSESGIFNVPAGMAVSPDGSRLYLVDTLGNSVSVIDTATNISVSFIPVAGTPQEVVVHPDGTRLYVTVTASNSVEVFDTGTEINVGSANIGDIPSQMVFTPNGAHLYVLHDTGNQVSVIETAGDTVLDTITVGNNVQGIAMAPDGLEVFVANKDSNTVSVIETTGRTVTDTIPVPASPTDVAMTPDGNRIYVTSLVDASVSVIDRSSKTIVKTLNIGGNIGKIFVAPAKVTAPVPLNRAYVTNYFSNSVSVVDTATSSVVKTIDVGNNPFGVAASIDGTKIYVTNQGSDSVSVIEVLSDTVIGTISTEPGGGPGPIFMSPDGAKAYILERASGNISMIDPTTDSFVQTFGMLGTPAAPPTALTMTLDGSLAYVTYVDSGLLVTFDTATNTLVNAATSILFPAGIATAPDGNIWTVNTFTTTIENVDPLTLAPTGLSPGSIGGAPRWLIVTPDNTKIYATDTFFGGLDMFDILNIDPEENNGGVALNNHALNNLILPPPDGLAFNPEGTLLYVPHVRSNALYVVDPATLAVVDAVAVTSAPAGVAVVPAIIAVCGDSIVEGPEQCDDGDTTVATSCGVGACFQSVADTCVNSGLPGECTDVLCVPGVPAPEICNGIDDDCNGFVDDIDGDLDGVNDCVDNCVGVPNPTQADFDLDGIGDACDPQTCGNAIPELPEQCDDGDATIGASCGVGACFQTVADTCVNSKLPGECTDVVCVPGAPSPEICNGIDDDCNGSIDDIDADVDGVGDCVDNCVGVPNPTQADLDLDGIGDACDPQTCGNGILEFPEQCEDGGTLNGDGCSSICELESAAAEGLTIIIIDNGDGTFDYIFEDASGVPIIEINGNVGLIDLTGTVVNLTDLGGFGSSVSLGSLVLTGTTKSVSVLNDNFLCAVDDPAFLGGEGILAFFTCSGNPARITWRPADGNACGAPGSPVAGKDAGGVDLPQYTCEQFTQASMTYAKMSGFTNTVVVGAIDSDTDGAAALIDCNDNDPAIIPGTQQSVDFHGFGSTGICRPRIEQCNAQTATFDIIIDPGQAPQPEICDNLDNSCSGLTDCQDPSYVDTTLPVALASLIPSGEGDEDGDDDEGMFQVGASCSDNCDGFTGCGSTAVLAEIVCGNGQRVTVSPGDLVELENEDEDGCEIEVENDDGKHIVEVEGKGIHLLVTCTDAKGNVATLAAIPAIGSDNDDENELDD